MRKKKARSTAAYTDPYVGGITGGSHRFRTRIGDLLADMLGFHGDGKIEHSSGGRSLHIWSMKHRIKPLDLHLAWAEAPSCHRCLEVELHAALHPELNRVTPSRCPTHDDFEGGR